jgi:hypothetical protein
MSKLQNDHGFNSRTPNEGADVPGVLPVAAPGAVAGARAFLALAASTSFVDPSSAASAPLLLFSLCASAACQPLPSVEV